MTKHSSLELRVKAQATDITNPVAGDVYYNTSDNTFMRFNGALFSGFKMTSSTSTSTTTSSSTSITTSTSTTSTSSSSSTSSTTSISTSTTTTL